METTLEQFLKKRQQHGAKRVDLTEMEEQSSAIFPVPLDRPISELGIECMEFMLSACRSTGEAVAVLDRLEEGEDLHLVAALKKYVEDTGQALKEIDNRLKIKGTSLEALLPELPGGDREKATWRNLIGRRDVIAHKLLTVDDAQVYEEAARDFRALHDLLDKINFIPATTDLDNGLGFDAQIRAESINQLQPSESGNPVGEIGTSVIFIFEDIKHGVHAVRLGRSSKNKVLIACTKPGLIRFDLQSMQRGKGSPR